ncbi:unannotated protein [freshwater metagenome]|uniref:Unannotated protein n=1 Tax=freshwater metagenome TaxID=449393 RepID=A0A6J6FNR9_9ZZZZ
MSELQLQCVKVVEFCDATRFEHVNWLTDVSGPAHGLAIWPDHDQGLIDRTVIAVGVKQNFRTSRKCAD